MKKALISLIALFIMLTGSRGQPVIVDHIFGDEGMEIMFSDVNFINQEKGFVCGGPLTSHLWAANVFVTNDGGHTWEAVDYEGFFPWYIFFRNDSSGYIKSRPYIGDKTTWFETVDSGETWVERDFFSDSIDVDEVIDIFFLDEYTGFAALNSSDSQDILRTLDGGESWEFMWHIPYENNWIKSLYQRSLFFVDENNGWAWDETHLIIFSDSANWKIIPVGTNLPLNVLYFCDDTTGWIAGGFNNNDGFYPVLLKTEDGGKSWNKTDSVNYLIHDLYFRNNEEGWAVGEDGDRKGMIMGTFDGGKTWIPGIEGLPSPLYALFYRNPYLWAVGDSGLIVRAIYGSFWIAASSMENAPFVFPGKDTVCVSVTISNPFDYQLDVFSIIHSLDGAIQDTIAMIEQGDHLWKSHWPVVPGERDYRINLLLIRKDISNVYDDFSTDFRFTTRGPLRVQNCFISSSDTIPNPADVMKLSMILKNEGLSNSIDDISIRLTTQNEYASIDKAWKDYPGTIPAGDTIHLAKWKFVVSGDCPYGTKIPIAINIAYNDFVYWSDTVSFLITKPAFEDRSVPHIYPNPAMNTVNIDLSYSSFNILIELYDMRGTVLYRKAYDFIRYSSVERIEVSHLPAGLYFVKVVVDEEVTVEKLLVY